MPGGHIENGESAKEALTREIHEEIGDIGQKIMSFMGVSENIFEHENALQHELNIIFEVKVSQEEVESRKNHIEFVTIKGKNIEKTQILPIEVKEGLLEWMENKNPFFKELDT